MLQYYCTTVLLYYCTTVLLYYCTTVLLYYCTTVLLYYCTTVLLYYCTTVLLYYCTCYMACGILRLTLNFLRSFKNYNLTLRSMGTYVTYAHMSDTHICQTCTYVRHALMRAHIYRGIIVMMAKISVCCNTSELLV